MLVSIDILLSYKVDAEKFTVFSRGESIEIEEGEG